MRTTCGMRVEPPTRSTWSMAAQVIVAVGGQGFEGIALDLDDGDVEGAAAQIVNQHPERLPGDRSAQGIEKAELIAVGDGGRRGLVEDVQDIQAGELAGVHGG